MTAIGAIAPITASSALAQGSLASATQATDGPGFAELLQNGLQSVETKVSHAEQLSRQFVLDGSVPVHQVTMAMEEARLSVELAMQVRARLVEAYRDLMNMQL